jgi:hypothetical protein
VRKTRPVGPVHLIQRFISSPLHPSLNRSESHTIEPCGFTPRSTPANRTDQSSAPIRHRTFLSIFTPQQSFYCTLKNVSLIATVPNLVALKRSAGTVTCPFTPHPLPHFPSHIPIAADQTRDNRLQDPIR